MVQMRVESMKKYKINEETERVIEKDDSASSITTDCGEGKPYILPYYKKLTVVMDSVKFQMLSMILVLVEIVVTMLWLLIEFKVIKSSDNFRNVVCPLLRCTSMFILATFNVEMIFRVIALRLRILKSRMEFIDILIITGTLTLDVVLYSYYGSYSAAGLLISLRFWRLWKIYKDVIEMASSCLKRQLRHEKRRKEAVERELTKYRQYCTLQDKEITFLQNLLKKYGISFSCVENPTVGETISVVVEVNNVAMDTIARDQTIEKEMNDYLNV